MRHWAYTLDAARAIVRTKAVNSEFKMVAALIVIGIVVGAIIDFLKLSKTESAKGNEGGTHVNLAHLPPGSIIVLPKGTE